MTYAKSSTSDASRILCLRMVASPNSFGLSAKRSVEAIVETFLKFSPRLVHRVSVVPNGADVLWLFLDIASTSHLFHGEEACALEACALAQVLGYGAQYSVSDTPSGAQAFIAAYPNTICPQGEERDDLKKLSLPLLVHLEGVQAWSKPSQIEHILTFFLMIGFKTVGDLARLSSSSFHERWGSVGLLLWKRLNGLDRAVISPLVATEPLEDYVHLDFPITLVSLLLRHSEKSLEYLFARLQGRRLFASRMVFTFFCEYSGAQHRVVIEPNTPSRNLELFKTLLENRLGSLDLLNPIRDFEVSLVPCPEKVPQLDFFEARVTHADRLETLFSLLMQSSVKPGLFELQEAIMPEESWRLVNEPVRPEDITSRRLGLAGSRGGRAHSQGRDGASAGSGSRASYELHPSHNYAGASAGSGGSGAAARDAQLGFGALDEMARTDGSTALVVHGFGGGSFGGAPIGGAIDSSREYPHDPQASAQLAVATAVERARSAGHAQAAGLAVAERSIAYTPAYGANVNSAPRPTRLLNEPIPLAIEDLERLKVLSSTPIERLENAWWEEKTALPQRRDYYFAVAPEGQCLWIFQDPLTEEYFLHGYFD